MKTVFIILLTILAAHSTTAQYLDSSFGKNGIVVMPFDANSSGTIYSIAQQADGKIVVLDIGYDMVRYHLDGTVDSSFGVNGRLTKKFSGHYGGGGVQY